MKETPQTKADNGKYAAPVLLPWRAFSGTIIGDLDDIINEDDGSCKQDGADAMKKLHGG